MEQALRGAARPRHAREVLDADHAGLEDVKDRIVEYIAVKKLRQERGSPTADAARLAGEEEDGEKTGDQESGSGQAPRRARSSR